MEESLPLPPVRCLSKEQAAVYLGIGVTLLAQLDVPEIRFGRRCVYDRLDLDAWLDEHKGERRRVHISAHRGRRFRLNVDAISA